MYVDRSADGRGVVAVTAGVPADDGPGVCWVCGASSPPSTLSATTPITATSASAPTIGSTILGSPPVRRSGSGGGSRRRDGASAGPPSGPHCGPGGGVANGSAAGSSGPGGCTDANQVPVAFGSAPWPVTRCGGGSTGWFQGEGGSSGSSSISSGSDPGVRRTQGFGSPGPESDRLPFIGYRGPS